MNRRDDTGIETTVRIPSPMPGKQLHVVRGPRPHDPRPVAPTIYVHGATFPAALAVGWRFDGVSWMDDLARSGLDVWGFDFLGFGSSSRYDEMQQPASSSQPLGRAPPASMQLAAVARHVMQATGARRVNLIAHSWGTLPAGVFAAAHPGLVDHLVLFGPILGRNMDPATAQLPDPEKIPAHRLVSVEAQWKRFTEDVPAGHAPVLLQRHFAPWSEAYLDTDAASRSRTPPAVMTPAGPAADVAAAWQGRLVYDPAAVRARTLLVRGEWDSLCNDHDAAWYERNFTGAASRRDVKIAEGSHLMHLEESRAALWKASRDFILDAA